MKLTEKLKGKLKNAASAEEANKILAEAKKGAEEAGVILDEEDLDNVAGGLSQSWASHLYSAKGDLQKLPFDTAKYDEEIEWRRKQRLEDERIWKMKYQQ